MHTRRQSLNITWHSISSLDSTWHLILGQSGKQEGRGRRAGTQLRHPARRPCDTQPADHPPGRTRSEELPQARRAHQRASQSSGPARNQTQGDPRM